jgi:4-hydroxythreonine-4-phosphate dehydrogenase
MAGDDRPLLAVTMGDPAGVGPEVIAKALAATEVREQSRPLVVGDAGVMRVAVKITGAPLEVVPILEPEDARIEPGTLAVLDLGNVDLGALRRGVVDAAAGRVAIEAIWRAAELAVAGRVDALVTAPIHKEAARQAGLGFPGHTEALTHLCGLPPGSEAMMLASDHLRIAHVTTHRSIASVPDALTTERIAHVARLAAEACRLMEAPRARVALAALNPHAGEHGLFGDEEERLIAPAREQLRAEGLDVDGPYPPDTIFHRAFEGEFDAVVAMYHDQGHVAMKMVCFDDGVNVTLGLPIIRTSVDHGTAFDIAGTGTAREVNMLSALRMAARMARTRAQRREGASAPAASRSA